MHKNSKIHSHNGASFPINSVICQQCTNIAVCLPYNCWLLQACNGLYFFMCRISYYLVYTPILLGVLSHFLCLCCTFGRINFNKVLKYTYWGGDGALSTTQVRDMVDPRTKWNSSEDPSPRIRAFGVTTVKWKTKECGPFAEDIWKGIFYICKIWHSEK